MVLVEANPHEPAMCEFNERAVIGRHAGRRYDVQLRTEGEEDVGLEHALDYHNLGIARKIDEMELGMERAARAGSVRQIRRGEPEVSQPFLRGQRQPHLAGLNAPGAVAHGDEQSRQEIVFGLAEMHTLPMFPESRNAPEPPRAWKVAIYFLREQPRDVISLS